MARTRGVEQQPRGLDRPTAHHEQPGPDLLVSLRLPVHDRGGADQAVIVHEKLAHQRVGAQGETAAGQGAREQRVRRGEDRADVAAEHAAPAVVAGHARAGPHLERLARGDQPEAGLSTGDGSDLLGAAQRRRRPRELAVR